MRRFLLILLLALLPLQFSWAAVAGYCQHETGPAAKHFGHHAHQHGKADAEGAKDVKTKALLTVDGDCSFCHLSAAVSLPAAQVQTEFPVPAKPQFSYRLSYDSHIPMGLERPDRGIAV